MTIFVSVAAFCDPHLQFTLDGIFSRARDPKGVSVAVVDQSFEDNRGWLQNKEYWPQIQYVHIHPIDARGVSWARSIAFSLYQGQDYLLQIDSHTYFDNGWDATLISALEQLRARASKPILSTYPPPFEFDEQGAPFKTLTPKNTILVLRPHPDTTLSDASATLRFRAEHVHGDDFIEGYHLAAGFLFTLGQFIEEIPYDPFMYFHGEEQNIAIRAYTHGWTIFHPPHRLIPIYHLYKQAGNDYATHHWHKEYEAQRTIKWTALKSRADQRLKELVYGGKRRGAYALGTERSLKQFADASGIDYIARELRAPRRAGTVDDIGNDTPPPTGSDETALTSGLAAVRCKHGRFWIPAKDQYIGKSLRLYGEWAESEIELIAKLVRGGDVVVEVGSNIGSHTVPLAKMVGAAGSVFAFEPQRLIFQVLCANLMQNGITNVFPHNCAVGRLESKVNVPDVNLSQEYNFGGVRVGSRNGIATPLVTIDSLKLEKLDFLKIEAEDFEPEVLLGAMATIDRFQPSILLEYNPHMRTAINRVLRLFNYSAWKFNSSLYRPNNWADNAENVFGGVSLLTLVLLPEGFSNPPAELIRLDLGK